MYTWAFLILCDLWSVKHLGQLALASSSLFLFSFFFEIYQEHWPVM